MLRRVVNTVVLTVMALAALASLATADVPQMLNYQGKLTDSLGEPLDTTVSITFTIYDDSSGETSKWTETQPTVTVVGGLFNVVLGGSVSIDDSVFNGPGRFLGIQVGTDPEITPRTRLISAPYSHRVSTVDRASGGLIRGKVGIGYIMHSPPAFSLEIRDTINTLGIGAGGANIALGETGAGQMAVLAGENSVGPGGTLLLKTTGDDGLLYDRMAVRETGHVGIGLTEPDEKLTVDGNVHVTGNLIVDGDITYGGIMSYNSGWFQVTTNTVYAKPHGLGTAELLVQAYLSNTSDGSGDVVLSIPQIIRSSLDNQIAIVDIDATNITLRTQGSILLRYYDASGSQHTPTSGYCKIIALSLE
jgi:hypothetical protein